MPDSGQCLFVVGKLKLYKGPPYVADCEFETVFHDVLFRYFFVEKKRVLHAYFAVAHCGNGHHAATVVPVYHIKRVEAFCRLVIGSAGLKPEIVVAHYHEYIYIVAEVSVGLLEYYQVAVFVGLGGLCAALRDSCV